MVEQARCSHVDELTLEVVDDPRDRQRVGMPGEAQLQAGRQKPEKPASLQLGSGQAFDIPGATEPTRVAVLVGQLLAEAHLADRHRHFELHPELVQGKLQALGMSLGGDQGSLVSMCRR